MTQTHTLTRQENSIHPARVFSLWLQSWLKAVVIGAALFGLGFCAGAMW